MDVKTIEIKKALGTWKPSIYLSNMAQMFYEEPTYAHRRVFPVCPVTFPSGHYYTFSKADLARDQVGIKPPYGTVAPAVFGINNDSYSCNLHQVLIGMDEIMTLPYQRANATVDPRRVRVRTISEQIAHHQEIDFAKKFFNNTAWTNTWTGAAATNVTNKQFKKFDNTDFDPVTFFDDRATEIRRNGRHKPNKLVLGLETYNVLKNHPYILERIKYSGTTQNPAIVNENVLAQVFGVDEVIALDATYNAAPFGAPEDMKFVCDPKGALLIFAPETPSIDTASAGYIFSWLFNGSRYMAVETHEGAPGTHTQIMEGLIAYDMRKTSDDLGIYFANCLG